MKAGQQFALVALFGVYGCEPSQGTQDSGEPSATSTATTTSTPCGPTPVILDGTPTDGDPAVVAINNLAAAPCERAGIPTCTGSLIGPDLVLTAAHCITDLSGSALGVLTGATAEYGQGAVGEGLEGILFAVSEVISHPDYDPLTLDFDVGLLRLSTPIDAPMVPLATTLDATLLDMPARVVGYGGSNTPPPFHKQEGIVLVSELDAHKLTYTPGPSLTCSGDSGGPVFMDVEGVETLVAVTSSGDPDCADHGTAIRIDVVADFISGAR